LINYIWAPTPNTMEVSNMANKRLVDGYTNFGGGFIFSQGAGGLYDMLDHFQAGKLYLTGSNATKASGTFENAFTSATDPNFVGFQPCVDPSGRWYVSSITSTGFVVTFTSSPAGVDKSFPFQVGNWFTCM
jgi:hypothetical protein